MERLHLMAVYGVLAVINSYEGKDFYLNKYKPAFETKFEKITAISEYGQFLPDFLNTVKTLEKDGIITKKVIKGKKFKLHSITNSVKFEQMLHGTEERLTNEEIAEMNTFIEETKVALESNSGVFSPKNFLDSLLQ